jgi:hypothetical protein
MSEVYTYTLNRLVKPRKFYEEQWRKYHKVLCALAKPEVHAQDAADFLNLAADGAQDAAFLRQSEARGVLKRMESGIVLSTGRNNKVHPGGTAKSVVVTRYSDREGET